MASTALRIALWALFLVLVALTTSCAASFSQTDKLADVVYPFYDAWRWKKLPSLAKRIPPEEKKDFIDEFQHATGDVQFADYEVSEIEILEDKLTAQVTVTFEWYRDSDPTLVEAQILETWEREKRGKPWYRTGQDVVVGHMP
jgi:hypothetical protein